MKLKKSRFLSGALAVLFLLAAGCRSDSKRAPGLIDDEETEAIVKRIEKIKDVYHLCPSPAEMLSVIEMSEMSFNGSLLNPPEYADQYLDARSQTLNLGVYLTDLAYSALFGRQEETMDYLEVVRTLADEIRVAGAINNELIDRARHQAEYLDSLFNISNEAFVNMLFFCERNQRPGTIVLLSGGAFVESMYLAVSLVGEYEDADPVLQHLAEQKYALDHLMTFAQSMQEEDPTAASLVEDLKPLSDIYDGIRIGQGATTVKKDESNKLVIGGSSNPTLSQEEFNALKQSTLELRGKITGI